MDLSCGYLHAKSLKKKARAISDIIAKGKITMLYDNRLAEAEDVVIDPEKGTAILTGDPKITDIASRSKLLGERIVLDKENKKQSKLEDEFQHLRLELEVLITHARVENIAEKKLDMEVTEIQSEKVIKLPNNNY
jgi:cell division protein FtsL